MRFCRSRRKMLFFLSLEGVWAICRTCTKLHFSSALKASERECDLAKVAKITFFLSLESVWAWKRFAKVGKIIFKYAFFFGPEGVRPQLGEICLFLHSRKNIFLQSWKRLNAINLGYRTPYLPRRYAKRIVGSFYWPPCGRTPTWHRNCNSGLGTGSLPPTPIW